MRTKAIIFDKDGTLMDFDSFWVTLTRVVVEEVRKNMRVVDVSEEEILAALGVEHGVTNINGVLCYGTYAQIGSIVCNVLENSGYKTNVDEVTKLMIESYHRNYEKGIIKPTCHNLCKVLSRLKSEGIKLAVVTTDDSFGVQRCLQVLGIEEYFDAVYSDDGKLPAKPEPHSIYDFLAKEGLAKSEVIMVGDTLTDTVFAKNAEIKVIGVAKSDANKQILAEHADAVIPDISYIFEVLE